MNKSDIATLINFNFWANNRILIACERISVDEFTRLHTPDPGWGSLRGILVHALDTEYGWRSVLQKLDEDHILKAEDFDNVPELRRRWDVERAAWLDYLAKLTDESINLGHGDNPSKAPKVWQTILHVVTHGIQHRSEAAAILTGYGQSPGELDFDLFLQENPEFP
ncbi:MAG TPA: DinB family protein [Anaerolineaceae bacterium]|nr:DinB family protein [Anaerolineaceae bacterium]